MYAMRVITTSCKLGPIEGISGYQAPLFMCVTARFPCIGRQSAQVTLGQGTNFVKTTAPADPRRYLRKVQEASPRRMCRPSAPEVGAALNQGNTPLVP